MDRFQNYSVLVVDDDVESLESMSEYLEFEFSTVYRAKSAKDALNIVTKQKPDIIFTDIQMPEDDGFSLIYRLDKMGIKTPIIVISAYDDKEKLLKAIKLHVVDYLVKPLDSKKLKEAMRVCYEKLELPKKEIPLRGDFLWNQDQVLLTKNSKLVNLTKSETKLLQMLVENLDKPMDSIDLFYHLWDYEDKEYDPKNIRNIVYKLRKKLGYNGLIENMYGGKYMISSAL